MSWKIPFIANIPIEKEQEWNEQINTELIYENEKERRIARTFNKPISNLRKVADYVWVHLNEDLCLEDITKELNIPLNSIKILIGDLNFFNGFPITLIPIRKKKGYVQSVLKNEEDYERWDRKKMKTITSMNRVKNKAEKITASKRTTRKKVVKKQVIKNENTDKI